MGEWRAIILPKFLATARRARRAGAPLSFGEFILRVDYLASTAWSTLIVAALLGLPEAVPLSPLALVISLPYFTAQAADLTQSGYRRSDFVRVYALNILLLPVNAAGILKSVEQALTRRKIPFARTPKVSDRTATPPLYVLLPWVLIAVLLHAGGEHVRNATWGGLAFTATTAVIVMWGITTLIGVRASLTDLRTGLAFRLSRLAPHTNKFRRASRLPGGLGRPQTFVARKRLGLAGFLSTQARARHASG